MLAAVSDWVKSIVLVVLFASFLELLLPASSMQRFIRVIMGLLVMLTMLNPVVEFIQSRTLQEPIPAMSGKISAGTGQAKERTAAVVAEKNRLTVEIYKNDLARQIKAVVLAIDGVADARITVELQQDNAGRSGALDKVIVSVLPGAKTPGLAIAPIAVGGQDQRSAENSPELKGKIVRTVRELYQLRDSQVEIKAWNQ